MTTPRISTAYVSKYQRTRIHGGSFLRGDQLTLTANLNGALDSGVTITAVTWRVTQPMSIILGTPDFNNRTATVGITAGWGQGSGVKCVITASDGSVWNQLWAIRVYDAPWFQGETAPTQGAYSVSA